jgi:nitrous oxide reductase accessory protein NosL
MKKLLLVLLLCAGTLLAGEIKLLDQNASDPVYQLPLKEYPEWLCEATLENGKTMQFVSVKSMMQVYQHQAYFIKHELMESPIKALYVQDFMNGKKIDATRAVYVFGSKVVGPHGDDLIPLASEERAKLFMMKNGGTKILPYQKLNKGLIHYLDM